MNPIVQLTANALPGEKKYILFVGAGVSKDAGVPTAWDLMLKTAGLLYVADNPDGEPKEGMEKWFIESKYSNLSYAELIGTIYTRHTEQQDFLSQYLIGYKIGEAHKGIAELARRGIIRAIITTNFDSYIEKALEEVNLQVQIISTEEDLNNSEPLIHCKGVRIYKPHGDLGKGAIKNTPKDLESLNPLMEQELIRVLSEHGVIILGYAGHDKGIQKVFEKRKHNYYPQFWVNPEEPNGQVKNILKDYQYIPCISASKFIQDFIKTQERVSRLAPSLKFGVTLNDLEQSLNSSSPTSESLFKEYLNGLFEELVLTKPDFTKSTNYDDPIVEQINQGIPITYKFIEASIMANKYKKIETLKVLYNFFGDVLTLYNSDRFRPIDGSTYTYRETDFDGFKFLGYEMFVGLIVGLIKFENWNFLNELLNEEIFVSKDYGSGYKSFVDISRYTDIFDIYRNQRLNLRRISLSSDFIRERFTQSELSELISHKEFMDADYFLFMRTVSYKKELTNLFKVWYPRSCLFLYSTPLYLMKAENIKILAQISRACGYAQTTEFVENFSKTHHAIKGFFRDFDGDDPVESLDFSKLGTKS